jgi:hypothetical protein
MWCVFGDFSKIDKVVYERYDILDAFFLYNCLNLFLEN